MKHTTRGLPGSVMCALGFLLLATVGCDPGFGLSPVDSRGNIVDEWSETIDGVRFTQERLCVFLGSTGHVGELNVDNRSTANAAVLTATLTSEGRTLGTVDYGTDGYSIPPGTSNRIYASCVFPKDVGDAEHAFGETSTWTWKVRVGDKERFLVVKMRKKG